MNITQNSAEYCQLFYSFFKIGAFTIGGGYVMLPLMEQELVDRRGWLSREEYLDCVALSQAMPGVLAVNMATSVGYRLKGLRGAAVAIVGNVLMPIVLILLLAVFFHTLRDNEWVARVFNGLRPAVVALIAAPVFQLSRSAQLTWRTAWIPLLAALLICLFGVSPVWIVLAAIVLGIIVKKLL
ncbi:MAG: chromate transporter [Bacteroidales bacterium]|nr:chromate transporter [Bacteroidales bacterium]